MKELLDSKTAALIYNAMVLPILTYCPFTTYDTIPAGMKNKITSLENRARRVIGDASKVPSSEQIKRKRVVSFVHRCINKNDVCENFDNYFQMNDTTINTRNKGTMVRLPRIRLEIARSSFYYKGALTFNSLPRDVRSEKDL